MLPTDPSESSNETFFGEVREFSHLVIDFLSQGPVVSIH
jgi:hypothetical protein